MSNAEAPVTFAIISSAPAASALLESVCTALVERTQREFKPVVMRSYDKLVNSMREGDVQVAWAPPLLAIELERETHAKIRLCSRRAGRNDYMSVLFVKKDSPIEKLADLAKKRIAWVARESSAGYVVPRLKLTAEGLDPENLFSEETFRRTHEAVVRAVEKDEADVGATYASFKAGDSMDSVPVTAGWVDAGLAPDAVRILTAAGPIPSDVIATASSLSEDTAVAITDALQNLGASIKALLNADSFEAPQNGHFDALRDLVASAHRRPAS